MTKAFADLSTPMVADACVRSGVPLRAAPPGIGAVVPGHRIAGRALPARHYGSVDVFLEAFGRAGQGDVLVIDNGGRAGRGVCRRPGGAGSQGGRAGGPGGVGTAPRHARAGGDRPSGIQLRQLPARPGAAGRAGARGAGHCAVRDAPGEWRRRCLRRRRRRVVRRRRACRERCWRRRTRSGRPSANRPARSGRARRCASRRPSTTTWRGALPIRRTPSGSISGGSAAPSRSSWVPGRDMDPGAPAGHDGRDVNVYGDWPPLIGQARLNSFQH